jgi:hypothetical protein
MLSTPEGGHHAGSEDPVLGLGLVDEAVVV